MDNRKQNGAGAESVSIGLKAKCVADKPGAALSFILTDEGKGSILYSYLMGEWMVAPFVLYTGGYRGGEP